MSRSRGKTADVIAELSAASGEAQVQMALKLVADSRDLEVVRRALTLLAATEDPGIRPTLLDRYNRCDADPNRRDGGSFIRSSIIRALQPISGPEDVPLLQRAMLTYEIDGALETAGDLRAAALVMTNDVDPSLAGTFACRYLIDPHETFSGEPQNSAIRLLASHGNLAPIFAMVSWGRGLSGVLAEGLRNLVELPEPLLPILIELYRDSEDEQILLGFFDLLLGHPSRDRWVDTFETWFNTTTVMDIYGVVAVDFVASRSEPLITMLKELRANEVDQLRQELLDQALRLL